MDFKTCHGCGETKPVSEFYWSKGRCATPCKVCRSARANARYALAHPRKRPSRLSLHERFWLKVDKMGPVHPVLQTRCWVWTCVRNWYGYGQFSLPSRRHVRAHRFAWELAHGPIANGLCILHRCDNPPCVNPDHLFLGTKADNSADMVKKGRRRIMRGEDHPKTHLTERDIPVIRTLYEQGVSHRQIARRYGIAHQNIRRICLRLSWTHIP